MPFSKPTVLESNAAFSTKLQNATNALQVLLEEISFIRSSSGFGSTSYIYWFVDNLNESSFLSLDSSFVSSPIVYMSKPAINDLCFAPEATTKCPTNHFPITELFHITISLHLLQNKGRPNLFFLPFHSYPDPKN